MRAGDQKLRYNLEWPKTIDTNYSYGLTTTNTNLLCCLYMSSDSRSSKMLLQSLNTVCVNLNPQSNVSRVKVRYGHMYTHRYYSGREAPDGIRQTRDYFDTRIPEVFDVHSQQENNLRLYMRTRLFINL